jgi:hypothetical protein
VEALRLDDIKQEWLMFVTPTSPPFSHNLGFQQFLALLCFGLYVTCSNQLLELFSALIMIGTMQMCFLCVLPFPPPPVTCHRKARCFVDVVRHARSRHPNSDSAIIASAEKFVSIMGLTSPNDLLVLRFWSTGMWKKYGIPSNFPNKKE